MRNMWKPHWMLLFALLPTATKLAYGAWKEWPLPVEIGLFVFFIYVVGLLYIEFDGEPSDIIFIVLLAGVTSSLATLLSFEYIGVAEGAVFTGGYLYVSALVAFIFSTITLIGSRSI